MRPKSLLLLALALGCGLVASIGISQVMDRNNSPHTKLETVPIYVALHNINLGDPIDAKMLSLQEWPKDKVPKAASRKLRNLKAPPRPPQSFEGSRIPKANSSIKEKRPTRSARSPRACGFIRLRSTPKKAPPVC